MKRYGFTLVEMLGVITVLAVISVIVVPMIVNQVGNKREQIKNSIVSTIDAAASLYVNQNKDSFNGQINACVKITDLVNKNLLDDTVYNYDEFGFDLKDAYILTKSYETEASLLLNCSPIYKKYDNGTIIYFNPEQNSMCSNPVSETGVKSGCMKWYIIDDSKNASSVKLLLDHNTTAVIPYGNELNIALANDISTWNMDVRNTARLITADEIARITGADEALKWNSTKTYISSDPTIGTNISRFYFDGASGSNPTWRTRIVNTRGGSKYSWLYDYTKCLDGTSYTGCSIIEENLYTYGNITDAYIQGYWTSTAVTGQSGKTWKVDMYGSLIVGDNTEGFKNGIRPVISISKSMVK